MSPSKHPQVISSRNNRVSPQVQQRRGHVSIEPLQAHHQQNQVESRSLQSQRPGSVTHIHISYHIQHLFVALAFTYFAFFFISVFLNAFILTNQQSQYSQPAASIRDMVEYLSDAYQEFSLDAWRTSDSASNLQEKPVKFCPPLHSKYVAPSLRKSCCNPPAVDSQILEPVLAAAIYLSQKKMQDRGEIQLFHDALISFRNSHMDILSEIIICVDAKNTEGIALVQNMIDPDQHGENFSLPQDKNRTRIKDSVEVLLLVIGMGGKHDDEDDAGTSSSMDLPRCYNQALRITGARYLILLSEESILTQVVYTGDLNEALEILQAMPRLSALSLGIGVTSNSSSLSGTSKSTLTSVPSEASCQGAYAAHAMIYFGQDYQATTVPENAWMCNQSSVKISKIPKIHPQTMLPFIFTHCFVAGPVIIRSITVNAHGAFPLSDESPGFSFCRNVWLKGFYVGVISMTRSAENAPILTREGWMIPRSFGDDVGRDEVQPSHEWGSCVEHTQHEHTARALNVAMLETMQAFPSVNDLGAGTCLVDLVHLHNHARLIARF